MSERPQARVECVCTRYRVEDLGLELRQGDVAWVKEDVARASPGLTVAMRAGAVSVSWRVRCEVARPATPPWLNRNTKGSLVPAGHRVVPPTPPTPPTPRTVPEHPVVPAPMAPVASAPDTTALQAAIRGMVEETVRAEVRAAFADIAATPQAQQAPSLDVAAISQALVEAMLAKGGMTLATASASPVASSRPVEDGPMYIPTGIVPVGDTPALDITAGSADGADLAGAQAALRAARRPKNPKT